MKHCRIFHKMYHDESTALVQSAINYWGLKLAVRDLKPRPQPASIVVKNMYLFGLQLIQESLRAINKSHKKSIIKQR